MKEIDPKNIAIFQEGKLQGFGRIQDYKEGDEMFHMNILITKGRIREGDFHTNLAKEYDVLDDGLTLSKN